MLRDTKDQGFGIDAAWNDDFHHSATVALTSHNQAYYTDTAAAANSIGDALNICIRGNIIITGRKNAAANPALISRHINLSISSKITISLPIPGLACAFANSQRPEITRPSPQS